MCGILYAKLRNAVHKDFGSIFRDALALMNYRGKDACGFYHLNNDYFGHVRLSILDLSERSNQPVVTANNILLFNGEIYNYQQLVPNAASDTLALANLIENNIDISSQLCGMYAILVYDKAIQNVRVFRDFYGEKPIYYYQDNDIFIVSSTIKSIVYILEKTFHITLKLHHLSLYDYFLCGYVREPRTIYEKIHMLSSGHMLNFSADWKISIVNLSSQIIANSSLDSEKYAKKCLQTTDVKPAVLLSSGVDSAYILNLMQDHTHDYKILTYRAPHSQKDESELALLNAKKICRKENVSLEFIDNVDNIDNLYLNYATLLEQPSSDGINLFNILLSSRQKNTDLKLVMMGTGGDELHGGYHSFKNLNKISLLRKLKFLKKLLPIRYRRFFEIKSSHDTIIESYYFLYRIHYQFLPFIPQSIFEALFSEFIGEMNKYLFLPTNNPQQKIKTFELFDYMRNQLLRDSDNISLYCGYEVRNPLLSTADFNKKPDHKKKMLALLRKRYNLSFAKKKGFTFCEKESSTEQYLNQKLVSANKTYNIFSSSLLNKLLQMGHLDIKLLRNICLLCDWLDSNKIKSDQLHGFII